MAKPTGGRGGKESRRREGEARNAEWRKLSPQEQLASLDTRLGVGVGAKRQRAKLKFGNLPGLPVGTTFPTIKGGKT